MRFLAMVNGFLLAASVLTAQQRQPLELQVRPDALQDELPPGFTILLVNKSDHDIRLPTPAVACASSYSGILGMSFHFTPKGPTKPGQGYGCSSDKFFWPPILERVKEWKVLDLEILSKF